MELGVWKVERKERRFLAEEKHHEANPEDRKTLACKFVWTSVMEIKVEFWEGRTVEGFLPHRQGEAANV